MVRNLRSSPSRDGIKQLSGRRRRRLFFEPLEERRVLAIDAALIQDIQVGGDSAPSGFVQYGGYTYFNADDGTTGVELWRTDGVTASLFADLHPTLGSGPKLLTVANGKLFFAANTPTAGTEVWVTDGVSAPQVFDVRGGNGSSQPASLISFNSELYFVANNGTGIGLWHTDGVAAASLVAGTAGLNPSQMIVSGGKLYFTAIPTAAPAHSRLYVYDGVSSVQGLNIISGSGSYGPESLVEFGGTIYFSGFRGSPATGQELFQVVTPPSGPQGVDIVLNINPGSNDSSPGKFTVAGTNLFFQAFDGTSTKLWRTHAGGTQKVFDPIGVTIPNSSSWASIGSLLYFVGTSAGGTGIFTSDGTTITSLPATFGMNPDQLTNVGGQLYFAGSKAGFGRELWYLSGSTPTLVKDIQVGNGSSSPDGLTAIGSSLYFLADDGLVGLEPWIAKDFFSPLAQTISQDAGGNLVITDILNGDDDITLQSDGAGGWTITGAGASFSIDGTIPAGITAVGNTIQIPSSAAAAFQKLIFNTNGGADKLTVALAAGDPLPSAGIDYNGGDPATVPGDQLAIIGGSQGIVTYNYSNSSDGSVAMSNYGTINYTGLEPISNGGSATDIIFNLPPGADDAFLEDDGTAANDMSRLRSHNGTFEVTTFSHPTGSLAINAGAGDSLTISLVDSLTAAHAAAFGADTIRVGQIATTGIVSLAATGLIGESSPSDAEDDVSALSLMLSSGNGIAAASNPLETSVTNLAWSSGAGGAFVTNSGPLTIGSLSAFSTTIIGGSGSGGATIQAASPLTVASDVIMGGAVNLTAGESATDDVDNLTVNPGITVRSTGNSVTLNSGDNTTVHSAAIILAATTVTINIDHADLDATGETLSIAAGAVVTAPGGATFHGGSQGDHFSFAPQGIGTAIVVNGNAPMVIPGDILNLDLTGATGTALTVDGTNDGIFTFANRSNVEYNSIEDLNALGGCYDLVLNMSAFGASGDFTVRRGSPFVGTTLEIVDNVGPSVVFSADLADIASLQVNGTAGADTLTVDDVNGIISFDPACIPSVPFPNNPNSAGTARLFFDGAGGTNTLNFSLAIESGTSQTYAIGSGAGPGAGEGEVLTTNIAGRNLVAYFRNLGPAGSVHRTGAGAAAGSLTVLGDANSNTITTTAAAALTTVNPATYTPFTFAAGSNYSQLNLQGASGNDTYHINGAGPAGLDNLLIPAEVTDTAGTDSLLVNDSTDASGDVAGISQAGIDGLNPLAGNEISFGGIETLDVTATAGPDTLTTNLGGAVASPTNFAGLETINVRGSGGSDTMFLHVADSLSDASLNFVNLFGDLGSDTFGSATDKLNPVLRTGQTQIAVQGGVAAATPIPGIAFNPFAEPVDKLFLDMTSTFSGTLVTPVVIVDTNGGNGDSANTQTFRFTGIEDLDLYDGGVLTHTAIGDFYLRGTDQGDYIEFRSAAQVNPVFRVRVGNLYYPTSGGNYGPYTTGVSKVYAYGRGGADTITMYNTRLHGAIFGEDGDDILTGGYGDDLIVGGVGNDRLNGAAVGGNDEIWGDDFNPATDIPAVASQTGTGNDQINTFGGNDTVYGQGGNDIINTGAGNDYLNGGPGDDQMDGQSGHDRLYAGSGNDTAGGGDGNDIVAGNAGNDILFGRVGNDILIGGLGQDIVNGNEGGDALVGDESSGAGSGSLASGDAADAALLLLMAAWGPPAIPTLASLGAFGSAGDDGSLDTLWGGAAADAFFGAPLDKAADRNALGYGPDLN
jgi:fibronectin-binding autotransporter adhesin